MREIDALRQGLERPPPADRQAAVRAALMPAALRDADDAEPAPPAGQDRKRLLTLLA